MNRWMARRNSRCYLIFQESKMLLGAQFQQYGMMKKDNELDEFAKNLLQNKEEKQRIIDQIINKKVSWSWNYNPISRSLNDATEEYTEIFERIIKKATKHHKIV